MNVKQWGNGHHGKVIDGDIQLPNETTYTLNTKPESGDTRLIKFDGLPELPILTEQEQAQLTAQGLAFKDYAILTDGKLYDKQLGADIWLYRAPDAKVWRLSVSKVETMNAQVVVTLTYQRFGRFISAELSEVLAVGDVVVTIESSNRLASNTWGISDISPNGNAAVLAIYQDNIKLNYVEITLSGAVDSSGNGLTAVGYEIIDQSRGMILESTNDTVSTEIDLGSIYRDVVNNDINYPPPSTGTPNSTVQVTRSISYAFRRGEFNQAGYYYRNAHIWSSSDVSSDKFSTIDKVLYDSQNIKHEYEIEAIYSESLNQDYDAYATGILTYTATYEVQYDSSGNLNSSSSALITSSINGSTQFRATKQNVIDKTFNHDIKRDDVSFSNRFAQDKANEQLEDYWQVMDGRDAVFSSNYSTFITLGHIVYNVDEAVAIGTTRSGYDLLGLSYQGPPVPPVDVYGQIIRAAINLSKPVIGFYCQSDTDLDITVLHPVNNLMMVKIGYYLDDIQQIDAKQIGEIGTPEGFDASIYNYQTGESGLEFNYSFNPYTFELVRESPVVVNFI